MLRTLVFLVIIAVAIVLVRSLIFRAMRRSKREPAQTPPVEEQKALPPPESTWPPVDRETASVDLTSALTTDQVFTSLHSLALGVEGLPPPDTANAPPRRQEFVAAFAPLLESAATEPKYSPRRPMLLPQLLQAVNDGEVSRREIANIIARDPALTGNLLKLANSSFYRTNAQAVESVDRAVALLGTDGIRSLIAVALIQPVFRSERTEFAKFADTAWEYTVRSATAAESHAAVVENTDPFAAQLLGLLMGLGELIVFRMALDRYAERGERPDPAVIAHLLKAHAAQVARHVAASWDLSDRILMALDEQSPASISPSSPLGRSLQFGRLIGALAVLNANDRVDDQVAKTTLLATGATVNQFDRFWTRLTGRPSVLEPKPHRPPSTLAD